jgi:hypothetical protein
VHGMSNDSGELSGDYALGCDARLCTRLWCFGMGLGIVSKGFWVAMHAYGAAEFLWRLICWRSLYGEGLFDTNITQR